MSVADGGFELGNDGPKVVLVGVDGSRTSMRAGAYAAGLARRQDALLLVVHVSRPSAMSGLSASTGALFAETMVQVADELRTEVAAALADTGLGYEFLVEHGDPYDTVVRLADERRADALVVGASESAGHRLVGSLATRLVRAARWPVTVVP